MKPENKQLGERANSLSGLLKQITDLIPEEMFADIRERAQEAENLLDKVIAEFGDEASESSFRLY